MAKPKMTPMLQQYMEIKENYKDCILFYRVGDFYEMFFDDALKASKILEITLTGKSFGLPERAPMCGVPFHSCDPYIDKLVEHGQRVAICEQVEDPGQAKGIVKRDVIRVVTPGTILSSTAMEEGRNHYIMGVFCQGEQVGISVCDITTGEFLTTQVDTLDAFLDEVHKYYPSEIICNDAFQISAVDFDYLKEKVGAVITRVATYYYDADHAQQLIKDQYRLMNLAGIGLEDYPLGIMASGALLQYLRETQKTSLNHLMRIRCYKTSQYMILDSATRRNLELTETLRDKNKRGSLLWVLDKTKTAMGARKLRKMVEQPLIHKAAITERLDAVEMLKDNMMAREELREYLNAVYDLERLTMRISYRSATPKDLLALKGSLRYLPYMKDILGQFSRGVLQNAFQELDILDDLYDLIEASIHEESPLTIKEGGIIKDGYDEEIDRLKLAKTEGKTWLAELEEKEKNRTGIKNLRIRYNKVFGYYIEVTNSNKDLVPDSYIRRQTLANAERYTTEELEELAKTILGAEDKLCALEYERYVEVREHLAGQIERIQKTAGIIAMVDAYASLALVAEQNNYVRPVLNQQGRLEIKNGRHPVVEKMMHSDMFVANDTILDQKKNRINIITGPNMAGKSTYMRQTALIVLMAQIGSFVPASKASIGLVDRIFTRVGASDDLASGQSTFMVEMSEVANILHHVTKDSLLILDEIGRGTSTYDGLSIAWSVVEYLSGNNCAGAKTLFATHYHELTELEGKIPGVSNYCIAVQEKGDSIIFLRKIIKGSADKSYGIQVAKLAGVPEAVIKRAKEISEELEASDITAHVKNPGRKEETFEPVQLSLFDSMGVMSVSVKESEIEKRIKKTDLGNLTPIQALNLLYELQNQLR